MSKKSVSVLICLSMMVTVFLWAVALDKYTVPQPSGSSIQPKTDVSEHIYIDFMNKVRGYPPAKKEEMKMYYRKKMEKAMREKF